MVQYRGDSCIGGDTNTLIPLFALGVLIGFILSQSGLVVRWCPNTCHRHTEAVPSLLLHDHPTRGPSDSRSHIFIPFRGVTAARGVDKTSDPNESTSDPYKQQGAR